MASPLTQLLKKDALQWNDEATEAFGTLKKAMITLSVLALPDFNEPFTIETDAFRIGGGVVLTQK